MNESVSAITPKPVEFRGSALNDLRAFPVSAKRDAGYQIDRIQHGFPPGRLEADEYHRQRRTGNKDSGRGRRFSRGLYREACERHLCIALFSKEDSENKQD